MASQVNVFRVAGINREIWVTQGEVAACFQLGWFWLVPFWNRIWAVVISDQSFSSFRKREEHCGADTGVDFHIDAVVTRLIFLVVLSYSRWSWWEKEEIWNVSKKTAWFFSSWQYLVLKLICTSLQALFSPAVTVAGCLWHSCLWHVAVSGSEEWLLRNLPQSGWAVWLQSWGDTGSSLCPRGVMQVFLALVRCNEYNTG